MLSFNWDPLFGSQIRLFRIAVFLLPFENYPDSAHFNSLMT
jgi:hypothetical protein